MRSGIVSTKVQANFHARIATPNNQNPLVCKTGTRLIGTGMNKIALEAIYPNNFRSDWLGILASGDDKPAGNVLQVLSPNPPKPITGIELSALDCLVEPGVY